MIIKFGGAIALDMGIPHEAVYQAFRIVGLHKESCRMQQ